MVEPPADPTGALDPRLAALRDKIDAVDAEIVELLNRRAGFALEVGEVKREVDAPVYRPEREAQVIARLRALGKGPLGGAAIEAIYREVISACRELERRMRVAYLGPPGTFSEQALLTYFGSGVDRGGLREHRRGLPGHRGRHRGLRGGSGREFVRGCGQSRRSISSCRPRCASAARSPSRCATT